MAEHYPLVELPQMTDDEAMSVLSLNQKFEKDC